MDVVGILAIIGAVASALISLVAGFLTARAQRESADDAELAASVSESISESNTISRLSYLGQRIDALNKLIEEHPLDEIPGTDARFLDVENRLDTLSQEIARTKIYLRDNPEEGVSIPLVRQEIDSVNSRFMDLARQIDRVEASVQSVGGLQRWFVGTLITISLALLGVVLTIVVTNNDSGETIVVATPTPSSDPER